MKTTTYKGYTGKLDFEDNLISGLVINIKDVITFHGNTIEEAITCFRESVDDYLDFCQELREEPEKPFNSYDYHTYQCDLGS